MEYAKQARALGPARRPRGRLSNIIYNVPSLEAFLHAVLLSPRSITSTMTFLRQADGTGFRHWSQRPHTGARGPSSLNEGPESLPSWYPDRCVGFAKGNMAEKAIAAILVGLFGGRLSVTLTGLCRAVRFPPEAKREGYLLAAVESRRHRWNREQTIPRLPFLPGAC